MKSSRPGAAIVLIGIVVTALISTAALANDWIGGDGNWSSDVVPGWNGAGVPNAGSAVANHNVSTTSLTVQDVIGGVTVGTISLTNNSNNGWMIVNNEGITFSNGGTSVLSNSNSGGTSLGALEIAGGTITLTDVLSINNTSSGSTIANGAIQISSLITGSGGLLLNNTNNTLPTSTTNFPGAIRIQGFANTFFGSSTVQKGLVTFNNATSLGDATNSITIGASGMGNATLLSTASLTFANPITFESGSGGTLTLGSMTTTTYSGTQTLNGDATFHSGTPGAGITTVTVSGAISGAGGITKTGPGIVSITNTGNSYGGNTAINEGQLRFAAPGSIGGAGASVTIGSGAIFSYGSTSNPIDQTILGRINPASSGTIALHLASANALDLNAAALTSVSLGSTAAVTYSGTLTPAANTFRFGGGTSTLTVSSALTGVGNSLVMDGNANNTAGIVILSNAANTYDGSTMVNSGQLRFTVPGAIGGVGASVTVNGNGIVSYGSTGNTMDQTFLGRINSTSTGIVAMQIASANPLDFSAAGLTNVSLGSTASVTYSGTLTPAGNTFRLGGGTSTLTVSSALTGAGNSLVVIGNPDTTASIVSLTTATNTYDGSTTVQSGQLRFAGAAQIGGSGASVTVNSGAIVSYTAAMDQAFLDRINPASTGVVALNASSPNNLDFNTPSLTGVSLGATTGATYSGTITPAANTFRLGGGTSSFTVSSVLSGANALVKSDGATATTVTLSGASTFDGPVSINIGTLSVASINSVTGGTATSSLGTPTSIANGTISFGSGTDAGALTFTGAGETSDRVINLAGTTGGATVTMNGTSTTSTPLILTGGVTATGAGSKSLTLGGTNLSNNTISGPIADNSPANPTSLVKTGTGKWVVTGPQNYSGTTAVNGGILQFASTQSLYNGDSTKWNSENLNVTSGDTLAISVGGIGEFAVPDIGRFHNLSTADGGFLAGSILGIDTSNGGNQAYANVLANKNTVGLMKLGSNALTLSAANTYNGTTAVNGGTLRITGSHTGGGAYSVAQLAGSSGNVIVDTGASVSNTSSILIGGAAGAAGTWTMESGSSVTAGTTLTVGSATSSTGSWTMNGGTVTTASTLTVGASGVGTWVQNAGDVFVNGSGLRISTASGGVGSSYTMNGGSITTAAGVPIQVGYNSGGNGTFTLNDGTITVNDWFVVGTFGTGIGHGFQHGGSISATARFAIAQQAGTVGDYTMDASINTPSITAEQVDVGNVGTGTMTQNAGTVTANYEFYLGAGATGNGTYHLGSGATLNAQYSNLGRDGTGVNGVFNNSGTFNSSAELRIGANYNQAGVLGGKATVNNFAGGSITAAQVYAGTGSNTLGYQSQGTINQAAATASITATSFLSLGRTTSSTGTFNLSDGTVTSAGDFNVGDYGTGILNQTGGSITTNDFVIAWQPSAIGTATLDGAMATITTNNVNGFYIGRNGNGTFNMKNGTVHVLGTGDMRIGRENQLNAKGTLNQTGGVINIADQTYLGMRKVGDFNMMGGTYNAGDNMYIGFEATATGTLTQTGGTINVIGNEPNFTGNVLVGYNGSGTINMNGGLLDLVVTDIVDAFDTLNSASYSIANSVTLPLDLAQDGNLVVGYLAGTGTVAQSSGTIRVAANIFVGAGDATTMTGTTGTYTMTGGQTIVGYTSPTGGDLVLGAFAASNGTFNLRGGTLDVAHGSGMIGAALGTTTAFNFTGGTLKVKEYNPPPTTFGGSLGGLVQNNTHNASVLDVTGNDTLINGGYTLTGGTAIVAAGRTLTIASPMDVGAAGTVKNAGLISVGGVTTPNLTMAGGSTYQWQLSALSTSNPGVDFGRINVAGDVLLSGNLQIDYTLLGLGLGPQGTDVFWTSGHTWRIIDDTSGNTGNTNFANFAAVTGGLGPGSWTTAIGVGGADDGDILLRYIAGDITGDAFVGGDDLNLVLGKWGQNVTPWSLTDGDLTGDGFVGGGDLNIILANWGQGPAAPGPGIAPVPEPATWLLGSLAVVGLVTLRRRSLRA